MPVLYMDPCDNKEIMVVRPLFSPHGGDFTDSRQSLVPGYAGIGQGLTNNLTNSGNNCSSQTIFGPSAPALGTWYTIAFSMFLNSTGAGSTHASSFPVVGYSDTAGSSIGDTVSDAYMMRRGNGAVRVKWGPNATDFTDTAPGVWATDTWNHIEYRHQYGAPGSFEVYVNGNLVLSGSGTNTGEPWLSMYFWLGLGTTDIGITEYAHTIIDDIIIGSNLPVLGITKVFSFQPTGTAQGQWLGSDSNSVDNHLLVDDGQKASADFVQSVAGANQTDLYTHGALPANASTIYGVQEFVAAGASDLGTPNVKWLIKSAAAEQSALLSIGINPATWYASSLLEVDPNTATAWSKAAVDAMTFGVRS